MTENTAVEFKASTFVDERLRELLTQAEEEWQAKKELIESSIEQIRSKLVGKKDPKDIRKLMECELFEINLLEAIHMVHIDVIYGYKSMALLAVDVSTFSEINQNQLKFEQQELCEQERNRYKKLKEQTKAFYAELMV